MLDLGVKQSTKLAQMAKTLGPMYLHADIHTYLHTYIYTYTCIYIHSITYIYMYVTSYTHVYKYRCICKYICKHSR